MTDNRKEIRFEVGGNLTLLEGKDVVFRCPVQGVPQPTINWYFKGQRVVPSDTLKVDPKQGTLTIIEITKEENGPYVCVATNSAGQDTMVSFVVTVSKYCSSQ